jgi:hypothetical protein
LPTEAVGAVALFTVTGPVLLAQDTVAVPLLIDPAAVRVVNTDEKAVEPPLETDPLTTLQVVSLKVTNLVQLVGAVPFSNKTIDPDAIKSGM